MQKKLLPALIGAALVGGMATASADVSLFGHLDAAYLGIDQDGGTDDTVFRCTTCSIGFKGSEDLGNGLKAIFSLDFQFDAMNRNGTSTSVTLTPGSSLGSALGLTTTTTVSIATSNAITDRDQWVGLAGGFGKVRVGTISTVYKSHGAMIDPLYRTALQGRDHGMQSSFHSGAGEELQGRATNTVRWDSADFNGVKLGAHYTLDSNESSEDDNPYGIGASYSNDNMLVFADYIDNAQSGTGERDAWKVGGKYDMGMFSVMGQYEDYSNSSTDDETAWHLAGGVNGLLGVNIYLGFGTMEDDTSNNELTSWTLAVSHNMSKNTMVYAGHSQFDCDAGGASATLSACRSVSVAGGEDDQTAIGLKHKF